ncbi:hypothetical protein D3C76_1470620 [compost metagenome]
MELVVCHVKLHKPDISKSSFRSTLIICQHLIHVTVRNAISVIIQLIDLKLGIVIVPGKHCNHVFVRFYNLLKNLVGDR